MKKNILIFVAVVVLLLCGIYVMAFDNRGQCISDCEDDLSLCLSGCSHNGSDHGVCLGNCYEIQERCESRCR